MSLQEKARSYLVLINQTAAPMAAEMAGTIAELLAENERLTALLRELASAEPVAWVSHYYPHKISVSQMESAAPLIRRPEMP